MRHLRHRWIAGMLIAETHNGTVTFRRPTKDFLADYILPRIRGHRDPDDDPVPGVARITVLHRCGAVECRAFWPGDK